MKQTIKNFGKALLGLVMPIKHQPLSKEWIEANKKELEKSVKSSAFRPHWMSKLNTTVKNEFKSALSGKNCLNEDQLNLIGNSKQTLLVTDKEVLFHTTGNMPLTTEQKLKDALEKLGSQPGYGKFEKPDKDYIKCDGTGTITHKDDIYYYAPSNLHLSKDFFRNVTKKQLENDFDIDNDDDFRAWVADKLLKVREF